MTFTKKNGSRAVDVLNWTMPSVHGTFGNEYVEFYVRHPITGIMVRQKHKFNRFVPGQERDKMMAQYIQVTAAKLADGWNPFVTDYADYNPSVSLKEVRLDYEQSIEMSGKRPKTIVDYENRLKHFCDWASRHNITLIGDCTPGKVEDYLHWRYIYKKVSAKSFNNDRTFLSAFFGWCVNRFYLKDNPCRKVKSMTEEPRQLQILSDKDLLNLVEYLEKEDKWFLLACLMVYYTMIRPNELVQLRLKDIHLDEQFIEIPHDVSKNHKTQCVAMPTRLAKLMIELHLDWFTSDKYLFGQNCRPGYKKARAEMFRYRWNKFREEFHLSPAKKFYSLKSNGIIDLINEQGVLITRDQARHSDIKVTNRYAQYGQNIVHEEAKRFKGKM